MPFPENWPSKSGSSRDVSTIRFYHFGLTTGSFEDNAFIFQEKKNCPPAYTFPKHIVVYNDGTADVLISFDGINIHGLVRPGRIKTYSNRLETGIAVRSLDDPLLVQSYFRIEAW